MAKRTLQELDVAANYTIGDDGISAIAGALELHDCKINKVLAEKCGFTFTGAKALADALSSTNCSIKELTVYNNSITVNGARLLFKSAVDNTVCQSVIVDRFYKKKDVRGMMKILEDRKRQQVAS